MTGADGIRGPEYLQRVQDERRRLLAALADPMPAQDRVLAEVLRENAGCEFGVAHGLADVDGVDAGGLPGGWRPGAGRGVAGCSPFPRRWPRWRCSPPPVRSGTVSGSASPAADG